MQFAEYGLFTIVTISWHDWSLCPPFELIFRGDNYPAIGGDLYPFGPEENNIWVRSGGRNGGILNNRTGSEAWEYAIRKMRNGAKPLANDLVDKIKSDFPNNDKVEVLEKLFKD